MLPHSWYKLILIFPYLKVKSMRMLWKSGQIFYKVISLITIFSIEKRSPLHSLRLSPMSNIGGKLIGIFGVEPTWEFFMDVVKEQYYPVGNYDDH
jgi:hypothetical protein